MNPSFFSFGKSSVDSYIVRCCPFYFHLYEEQIEGLRYYTSRTWLRESTSINVYSRVVIQNYKQSVKPFVTLVD